MIIFELKDKALFCTDAADSYWAMLIKEGDEYKTDFINTHDQFIYLRISQCLKGACTIYPQFFNLEFKSLSKFDAIKIILLIIDNIEAQ